MSEKYIPKRSTRRWLEGAPRNVIACYDNGGKSADRYTVLYDTAWHDGRGWHIDAFAASEYPCDPQGIGLHIDVPAYADRKCLGRKIKWADLPEDVKQCTKSDYVFDVQARISVKEECPGPQYVRGSDLPPLLQKEACERYRARYTMEHKPTWAIEAAKDGYHYSPQFTDDEQWLAHTFFLVRKDGTLGYKQCVSFPMWPTNSALRRSEK